MQNERCISLRFCFKLVLVLKLGCYLLHSIWYVHHQRVLQVTPSKHDNLEIIIHSMTKMMRWKHRNINQTIHSQVTISLILYAVMPDSNGFAGSPCKKGSLYIYRNFSVLLGIETTESTVRLFPNYEYDSNMCITECS